MQNKKTFSNPETACNSVTPGLTFDYYDEDEFKAFLDSLPASVAAKVIVKIQYVSTIGIVEAMTKKIVKKVDQKKAIYELRVDVSGIFARSLFFRIEKANEDENEDENDVNRPTYIITNSFKKKTNKIPPNELNKAIKRQSTYRNKL